MFLRKILSCLLLGTALNSANASVTLVGSRIIYPGTASSVDIQFKNGDNIPYLIQAWFDDGDVDAQPQQISSVPFIITPPVFRIQPKAGQVARVVFSQSRSLPQDRESMYWFNMLQIPPEEKTTTGKQNAMTVMLRNRIKLFYRPAGIGKPDNILQGITVRSLFDKQRGNGIEIDNAQPWFASLVAVNLQVGQQTHLCDPEMVAPFSQQTCWFPNTKQRLQGVGTVRIDAINDQGARISERYPIHLP